MSDGDLHYCAACESLLIPADTYSVQIDVKGSNHTSLIFSDVCADCAHSICDWLLSFPPRRAERYHISACVIGKFEFVDAPLTYQDLRQLTRWLNLEGDEDGD